MPVEANIRIGSTGLVLKSLAEAEQKVFDAGEKGLRRGLIYAVGVAQREFLSGPRPARLDVRTTRLRGSVTSKVERRADRVRGRIGTNVKYGAFHEFGFRGTQNVRAHTRVIQQVVGTGAEIDGRRVLRDRAGVILGFKESRKKAAGRQTTGFVGIQFVGAHTRRIDYAGRPFVRPAAAKAEPVIMSEIRKELKASFAG